MQQIRRWLFRGRAASWDAMSDLPQRLRQRLSEAWPLWQSRIANHHRAADGTEKLLLEWQSGGRIECVLLRDGPRHTICISTQVGCAMGCVFCASGLNGVERNLTTGEIVEQMLRLQMLLAPHQRLSHIVVMGMGEPLANLDQILPALEIASSGGGLGISARRITISTVGLPKAMDRLVSLEARYHLAVSLHAPNDQLRDELVPVNRQIALARVLEAADRYFASSGRRLTFEYVLLGGINDHAVHARQLGKLLQGRTALLNVIPYNPVAGLPYQTPGAGAVVAFCETVERFGVNVQVRQRKGDEISAACGQLRHTLAQESLAAEAGVTG
jgi:23S rRNA (adenine2503-C2)-methyltransferase